MGMFARFNPGSKFNGKVFGKKRYWYYICNRF